MQIIQTSPEEIEKYYFVNKTTIIDVREEKEYNQKHIPGAILMPLSTMSSKNIDTINTTNTNKKIIIYCHLGVRSMFACEKILNEHPKIKIYNLTGGIISWEKAGLPLNTNL